MSKLSQRVVICGINYAPEIAGVGSYTGQIAPHIASLGHDVAVVSTPPHYPGWRVQAPYRNWRWTKEYIKDVAVYRCPLYLHPNMKGWRRLVAPLSFALTSAPVTIAQILRRRPDVVICMEPTLLSAPAALLAAAMVGAKTVLHVQDLEVDAAFAVGHLKKGGALRRLAATFEQATLRRFDRIITISNRMADRISEKRIARDRIYVTRNWIDLDMIKPVPGASPYREELGLSSDDFVVLYSGNIGAKQGVRLVLDAAELLAENSRIVFVIAGDGPMRPAVAEAAARNSRIRLLPFQPEERFSDFLGLADLHVLPQERDVADLLLPSKLGGMLASGRRIVVTTDTGTELSDFIHDSCELVPPGDAEQLAEAISRISLEAACPQQTSKRLTISLELGKNALIDEFVKRALFTNPGPNGLSCVEDSAPRPTNNSARHPLRAT